MNINNIPQLSIKNNHLHMDGKDIVEIAGHYGTPLYIGSEQRIEDNVREVQQHSKNIMPTQRYIMQQKQKHHLRH